MHLAMVLSENTIGIDRRSHLPTIAHLMNSPFVAVFVTLAQVAPNALPSSGPAPSLPSLEQMLAASAILFIVALGMQILANWIVSKMLVSGENDFTKAVKLFAMTLAGVIGAVVVAGVIIFIGNAAGVSKAWIVAVVVFMLLILYVIFATPMSVYRIGFLRSFSFILLTWIIVPIGQFAVITLLQILLNGKRLGCCPPHCHDARSREANGEHGGHAAQVCTDP